MGDIRAWLLTIGMEEVSLAIHDKESPVLMIIDRDKGDSTTDSNKTGSEALAILDMELPEIVIVDMND